MSDETSVRLFKQLAAGGAAQQSAIDEIMRGGHAGCESAPAFDQIAASLRAEQQRARDIVALRNKPVPVVRIGPDGKRR
ncbi:MAG TPA: hypothetical protein VKV77_11210 [Methylovirgula sp.]|nr:hypothetical protein [Methylovirgula sp.]